MQTEELTATGRPFTTAPANSIGRPDYLTRDGKEMQGQTVCVYNQTNECFLSLGASRGENPLAKLKRWIFARGAHHLVDEGCWFNRPHGVRTLGVFGRRDLVYLDEKFQVLAVIESLPVLRTAPRRPGTSSLLALPVHTISSSQTRPGNQLVICAPEEMEARLRGIREHARAARQAQTVVDVSILPQHEFAAVGSPERHDAARTVGNTLMKHLPGVHVIRDISATGLYLVTRERWPVGSEVRMSLQRTGQSFQGPHSPITLQLRVTRWGADGVGLEFAGPHPEHAGLVSMYPC